MHSVVALCPCLPLTALLQFHFPERSVVTVWSCPNYCYRCGNVASILQVSETHEKTFTEFNHVPEPENALEKPDRLDYFA